ncbi:hypothetical protein ES703_84246 [subsurface metagenome]
MNIATIAIFSSQQLGRRVESIHCRISRAQYPGAQKKPEDFPAIVIIEKHPRSLLGAQAAPAYIHLFPERAVPAVARADIRNQRLKQNAFTTVWKRHWIYPPAAFAPLTVLILTRAARTRQIILRISTKYLEFALGIRFGNNAHHSSATGRTPSQPR